MANQRGATIQRVTVTLDEELLRALEEESDKKGVNRLELIREAVAEKLAREKKLAEGKNKNK